MEVKNLIEVGQLVDLKWKLGVAVSSDECKNLNSPFVAVTLTVSDPSGQVTIHNFEMTLQKFRDFSKQFKDIAKVFETV